MAHPKILDISKTVFVIVDVQEAFRGVVRDLSVIASRISLAVQGFDTLGVPVIVTEQYPNGLGRTAEEILLALPDNAAIVEKTAFSSCGATAFVDSLAAVNARQVILCGLETHICVNQTAHDLLDKGFDVHLLSECVVSRFDHDKAAGLAKMYSSGVTPSSVEMALFELMRDSRSEHFKKIQALIK